jgi:hypothetical protein
MMFRMGYVRRGEPAVHEERSLEDIFRRRSPIIAEGSGFDPKQLCKNKSAFYRGIADSLW